MSPFETCLEILKHIFEIASKLLSGQSENVYQDVLEGAMKIVPGAQAGSVLVRENDRFVYVAAVGYELEELRKATFSVEEEEEWVRRDKSHLIFMGEDIMRYYDDAVLKDERVDFLGKVGGIKKIKATLVIPVRIKDELMLVLNLDNFEGNDAFDENSIIMAKVLANVLGIIFSRLELENQLREKNQLLEYMSYHDTLTNLPNRRLLEEFAEKMLTLAKRENKPLSILFMDLDGFKPINDVYGHQMGDEVLKLVAKRLEKFARSSDTISRYGGDEFVILAYDCSKQDATALAERLVKAIEEPMKIDQLTLQLSASVGIATFPEDGGELTKLIRLADERLYMAKGSGLKIFATEISRCHVEAKISQSSTVQARAPWPDHRR
ncbi:sensor domain-containing diguanylate cyclase [Pseudothermotoga sp.]